MEGLLKVEGSTQIETKNPNISEKRYDLSCQESEN